MKLKLKMVKMREKSWLVARMDCSSKLLLTILIVLLSQVQTALQTYCEGKPKILFYQAGLVFGGGSASVVISNVNNEFLACVSSRNVEWAYEGDGEPSKFQESSTVDIQKYEDDTISYCLTSQITFSNKQSDTELSRHTGRYSCREIGNVTNTASVYVFASRRNSPTFLQSRKTITLPLSWENVTVIPMTPITRTSRDANVTTESINEGKKEESVATPTITIPCVTTRPNVFVRLLKKGKNSSFSAYKGGTHLFDPKYGFRLNASLAKQDDLSDFYGEYKCVSSAATRTSSSNGGRSIEEGSINRNTEDFVLITLVKPKSFQAFPPENEVYTSGILNLTCESEVPVIMKEVLPSAAQDLYSYLDEDDYGRDRSDDIVETTERTEQKTHVANYMEIAPAPGRSGEIQCLTEKEGKILHTWKYRIIRKRADKLSGIKFNKWEKSFTCKSKLGAPGRLSFVSCRTPSECRINKICLEKSEHCRGYSNATRAFCERKTHFCGKIFYKGGSGLIRCIGEGIDEIRGFTDEAAADQVRIGFGRLKASETALLQLVGVEKRNKDVGLATISPIMKKGQKVKGAGKGEVQLISEGDKLNVTLRMGYYYFLYPVQWAVKLKNGSTMQITPENQTLVVEKLTRTVYASLTLPYTAATTFLKSNGTGSESTINNRNEEEKAQPLSEMVALHALIPLRSSMEPSWKTITLPLTVYGRVGLPPLPSDNDEEYQISEQSTNNKAAAHSTSQTNLSDGDDEETNGDEDEEVDEEGTGQKEKEDATNSSSSSSTASSVAVSENVNSSSTFSATPSSTLVKTKAEGEVELKMNGSFNAASGISSTDNETKKEEEATTKVVDSDGGDDGGINENKETIMELAKNSSLLNTAEKSLHSPSSSAMIRSDGVAENSTKSPTAIDGNEPGKKVDDEVFLARSDLLLEEDLNIRNTHIINNEEVLSVAHQDETEKEVVTESATLSSSINDGNDEIYDQGSVLEVSTTQTTIYFEEETISPNNDDGANNDNLFTTTDESSRFREDLETTTQYEVQ